MRKTSPKNRKNENVQATFTRSQLCRICSTDPRTVDRRCAVLGIKPKRSGKGATAAICYDLTPDELEQLRRPLPRGAVVNGAGSSDLRQSKLWEEVEHLRLKNRKLRSESTPNRIVAEFLREAKDEVPDLIWRHLDKYADSGGNKEPAELRQLGKDTNDAIRSELFQFFTKWLPAFEGE